MQFNMMCLLTGYNPLRVVATRMRFVAFVLDYYLCLKPDVRPTNLNPYLRTMARDRAATRPR